MLQSIAHPQPFLSSSSSSSNPSSISSSLCNYTSRSMEEVWKDINLASLTDHPSSRDQIHASAAASGMILQDFLATSKDPPPPRTSHTHVSLFASPPPATVLSLNSVPEFHFLDQSPHIAHNVSSFAGPFDGPVSAFPSFLRKRVQDSDGNPGDRRHKRMIKNRESAARSRARKQAYTNELELEVAHLLEENARLRKQQEQLCVAAAAQLPKKHSLQRTSTAPF